MSAPVIFPGTPATIATDGTGAISWQVPLGGYWYFETIFIPDADPSVQTTLSTLTVDGIPISQGFGSGAFTGLGLIEGPSLVQVGFSGGKAGVILRANAQVQQLTSEPAGLTVDSVGWDPLPFTALVGPDPILDTLPGGISSVTGIGPTTYGLFNVSAWASLNFQAVAANNNALLRLTWYDYTSSALVGGISAQSQWDIPQGGVPRFFSEQVIAPYVQIDVFGVAAGDHFGMRVIPARVSASPMRSAIPLGVGFDGVLASATAKSVGAGATDSIIMPPYRGPVQVWLNTAAATYIFQIQSTDYLGNVIGNELRLVSIGDQSLRALNLPSHINTFSFTNNDAGAKTYGATVVPAW